MLKTSIGAIDKVTDDKKCANSGKLLGRHGHKTCLVHAVVYVSSTA